MATSPPSYPNSMFYIGNSSNPHQQRRSSVKTDGSTSSQGSVTFATSPPNMEGPIMFVAPDLPEETLLEVCRFCLSLFHSLTVLIKS